MVYSRSANILMIVNNPQEIKSILNHHVRLKNQFMGPKTFCQSCTMPIDELENCGTEKDGSKSDLYCKYCYQHGEFTTPEISFDEMKGIVVTQMKKMNLPEAVIQQSLHMLPHLKRWKKSPELSPVGR